MNNTEIKKLVNISLRPIIEKGFTYKKNVLYMKPLEELLVGFYFEKSGFNKDSLYIWSFVQPLYVPNENIILTFGKRLREKEWAIKNNPNLNSDLNLIRQLIEEEISSFITAVDTPIKFFKYYEDKCINLKMIESLVYTSLYIKHKDSQLILNKFIDHLKHQDLTINWVNELLNNMLFLKNIQDSKNKLDNLFKNNIEETVKSLGLLN